MNQESEAEPNGRVRTVERSGVAVEKTIHTEGATTTVTIEVTSTRSEPTTVRLSDPALGTIEEDALEVEGATVADAEADPPEFERELEPGGAWEITYRLADAGVDAEELEAAPRVLAPDGGDLDELIDRARSDALREFVGGERDSLSGSGTAEREEAAGPTAARPEPVEANASGEDGEEIGPDGVARALLAELREGDLDRETRAALRAELQPERSREVKLEYLQRRVSDLAAYTDTLERFIDEHGPIDEAFEGVESELETIRAEQADLEARIEELESEFDRVDDRIDELEAFRDSVSGVFRELGGGE
jgi:hypothetical protein